ncbi:MAG: dynamin family protein, partial [Anaerolineales bacterium]
MQPENSPHIETTQTNQSTRDVSLGIERGLLKRYTQVRRDEHEVITQLLDTLKKIDNLAVEQIERVRDALFHTDLPFLLALVGPFSAGKSSVINALLGQRVLEVGPVPTTDHIHILRYGEQASQSRTGETTTVFYPHPILESLSFVDTPGLESVFVQHDTVTRRFLHRADMVLLVMVATQVMSASNLDFLKQLKEYGKRTIIVVNQVDVLDDDDRQRVRDFVVEQSILHLKTKPTIWMASAKQAMEAQHEEPRDEILYDASGFAEIEEYLRETLNDQARIRQKLETPMQIATQAHQEARKLINNDQTALIEHQKAVTNIRAQVDEAMRDQRRRTQNSLDEIEKLWDQAAENGTEAIGDLFQFSRAFGQIFAGIGELTGVAILLRRFGCRTRAQAAFDKHEVERPLTKIPESVDALGAALEGRDLQDLDDLVNYTRQQIDRLPPNLKNKVIGVVQSPMSYDRSFLRQNRGEMADILSEARRFETDKIDRQLRTMLVVLAVWELIVLSITILVGVTSANEFDAPAILAYLGAALIAGLLGMALLPLRGWLLQRAYDKRMASLQQRYTRLVEEGAESVIRYGAQLRRDTAAPFTRLIESRTEYVTSLQNELEDAE